MRALTRRLMLRFIAGWCGLAVDTFGYEALFAGSACRCRHGRLPAPMSAAAPRESW